MAALCSFVAKRKADEDLHQLFVWGTIIQWELQSSSSNPFNFEMIEVIMGSNFLFAILYYYYLISV